MDGREGKDSKRRRWAETYRQIERGCKSLKQAKQTQRSKRAAEEEEEDEAEEEEEEEGSVCKDRQKDRMSISRSRGRGQRQRLQREGHRVSRGWRRKRWEIHQQRNRSVVFNMTYIRLMNRFLGGTRSSGVLNGWVTHHAPHCYDHIYSLIRGSGLNRFFVNYTERERESFESCCSDLPKLNKCH